MRLSDDLIQDCVRLSDALKSLNSAKMKLPLLNVALYSLDKVILEYLFINIISFASIYIYAQKNV